MNSDKKGWNQLSSKDLERSEMWKGRGLNGTVVGREYAQVILLGRLW
jgi:hypothetical protein